MDSTDKTRRIEKIKAAVSCIHMSSTSGDGNHKFMICPNTCLMNIIEESLRQGKTRELFMGWRFMSVCVCVYVCVHTHMRTLGVYRLK